MQAFGVIKKQCAADRVEHAVRGTVDITAFELRVVVGADSGEIGDLFTAQAWYPTRSAIQHPQASLIGSDLGPTGHQEVADFGASIHPRRGYFRNPPRGCSQPPDNASIPV